VFVFAFALVFAFAFALTELDGLLLWKGLLDPVRYQISKPAITGATIPETHHFALPDPSSMRPPQETYLEGESLIRMAYSGMAGYPGICHP